MSVAVKTQRFWLAGGTMSLCLCVAAAIVVALVGCDRQKGIVVVNRSAKPTNYVPDDDKPREETDPQKLLKRYLLYRDPAKVNQILLAHPELVDKEIDGKRPVWIAVDTGSLPLVK